MVYSNQYNFTMCGAEKYAPGDTCKYKKIAAALRDEEIIGKDTPIIRPSHALER